MAKVALKVLGMDIGKTIPIGPPSFKSFVKTKPCKTISWNLEVNQMKISDGQIDKKVIKNCLNKF